MTVDACESCGAPLYYHERVAHPQTLCFRCARAAGLSRICDTAGPNAAEISEHVVREILMGPQQTVEETKTAEMMSGTYPGEE